MKILLTSVPQQPDSTLPGRLKPFHKLLNLIGGGKPVLGIQPPYGLMYLSAYLKRDGHQVFLFDGLLTSPETILAALRRENISLAGISCVSKDWDAAMRLAQAIKQAAPGITLAAGGAHVNAVKEQVLHECEHFDLAFYGDSEETFAAAAAAIAAGKPVPPGDGVAFRDGGSIKAAAGPAVIKDLDAMLPPDRKSLGLEDYRPSPLYYRELPYTAIFGSRGCPHKCNFCHTERNTRMRSPESLVAEITELQKNYGVREIMFYDDTFTLDKARVAEFCELIIAKNIVLSWSASTRADSVDAQTLRLMKKAGCWKLAIGIESGSQRLLDRMGKAETVESIAAALDMIDAAGIQAAGFFMFGQPTETYQEGLLTIEFMKRLKLDFVNITSLTPFPGTEVYKEVSGEPGFRGLKAMNMFDIAYVPATMTEEQLRLLIRTGFRQFYFRPSYILRQLGHIRTPGDIFRYARGLAVVILAAFLKDGGAAAGPAPETEAPGGPVTDKGIRLSVIIACSRPAAVMNCLKGFDNQPRAGEFEVIVAGDTGGINAAGRGFSLKTVPCALEHPNARRNAALKIARAPVIAFIDDDAVPDAGWVAAALDNCAPGGNTVITGPEAPAGRSAVSRLSYAVAQNYFSEATRAHVNSRRMTVGWRDVPFCNCVVPGHFLAAGALDTDIPWDMDDFHFFGGLGDSAVFMNVPGLSITHDRYPDSFPGFLNYKWRLRSRTGEKLVTHPGLYWRIAPLIIAGALPWLILISAAFSPFITLRFITVLAALYALIFALQLKEAGKHGFRYGAIYMGLLFSLHCLSFLALQAGIMKALYKKCLGA